MAASPDETPTREEPEFVVLEGIVGSTAYGLAHEDSDVDRLGVFVEPTENFLGLDGVPVRRQSWKQPGGEDRALHEVGKFCHKLLGGNPTFTELLWLPGGLYTVFRQIGSDLIDLRRHFLSADSVRGSYFEYARDQFKKLEKRGDGSFSSDTRKRTEKHARHMARLIMQGLHAWRTGEIQVRLEFPESVRIFGQMVADGNLDTARRLMRDAEEEMDRTRTPLPEEPNREVIDAWLKTVRRRQLTL